MSAQPRLSPEEYLAIERAAEFKSEYYNGEMFAMSGGSWSHAIIMSNLGSELRGALRNKGLVVGASVLRTCVAHSGFYTYPDVIFIHGEPFCADEQNDTLLNPALIAEVLSLSTEAHDRGLKWAQYRQIESLREYVLVSQTEPLVEVYTRQSADTWLFAEFAGLEARARFSGVDCDIPMAEIYFGITFDARG